MHLRKEKENEIISYFIFLSFLINLPDMRCQLALVFKLQAHEPVIDGHVLS